MSRKNKRKLAARRHHTEEQWDKKKTLLRMSVAKAKRQRKGKALVIWEMENAGYVLRYGTDHLDPRNWRARKYKKAS